MLSLTFQRRVYNAHKKGKTYPSGNYEYSIEYNPLAATHTWIIRRRHLIRENWKFFQPLDESIM